MFKLLKFIFAIATVFSLSVVYASDAFEKRVFESEDGGSLRYRIHVPESVSADNVAPLVLFFHGAGERGSDNEAQLKHGVSELLEYAVSRNEPAVIVAPQCPKGKQWVDTPWSDLEHTMDKAPSESMALVLELLDSIVEERWIDRRRIYVTGLSMGGFGTWDIVQRRPKFFAAAMPICGGGDVNLAKRLTKLPLWVFHGDSDKVVFTSRSRDMVAAIRALGGSPIYTEYPDTKHNSWTPTYSDAKILDWLFSQRL